MEYFLILYGYIVIFRDIFDDYKFHKLYQYLHNDYKKNQMSFHQVVK